MVIRPLKPEELNDAERKLYDLAIEENEIEFANRLLLTLAERHMKDSEN